MSSKPVSAVATAVRCQCCATPPAARVLKQLKVSDQQLILSKLCVLVCVCLVMEVKVNLIRCDIRGGARE